MSRERRELYWALAAFALVLLAMAVAAWIGWDYWSTGD